MLRNELSRTMGLKFLPLFFDRAKQLLAGCTPRLEGDHSPATMAQMEVAAGRITRADATGPTQLPQCGWQL